MEIMVLVTAAIVVLTVILGCKGKKSEPSPKRPLKSVKQLLTLTKGAKSKRSHANSKGSSDLKTALPIEQSLAVEDTQQDPNKKKSKGEEKKKKKEKKEKEKEKKEKEKEKKDKKDKKAGHSKLKKGAEVAATQYGEVVQQGEVKKKSGEDAKEGKAKSKSPRGKSKSPKGGKGSERIISNPIVTPVTDEFPTDEEEGREKEMNKTKTAADKVMQRKDEQVVDYKKKKTKTGKDRNLSDPIVTPCTDEFPTEEEKPELKEEIQQTHA